MSGVNIGLGHVFHKRHGPSENQFRYPLYFLFFRLSDEPELQEKFRQGLWNIFSLRTQDYLTGNQTTLQARAKDFLKERCDYEADEVWLQTFPRMLGYVFNPVSFWICKRNGIIEAVLSEVTNTFGETHYYWIHSPEGIKNMSWLPAQKEFHVSPFFPVAGSYKFRFQFSETTSKVEILYYNDKEELVLTTGVQGQLKDISSVSPWHLLLKYGWMTPLVILRIHFQALRLFFKKAKFYSKPPLPSKEITK